MSHRIECHFLYTCFTPDSSYGAKYAKKMLPKTNFVLLGQIITYGIRDPRNT